MHIHLFFFSGIEYVGCVMNTTQLKLLTKVDSDQSDPSENEQMSEKGTHGHENWIKLRFYM